jgi:hypothetical protein
LAVSVIRACTFFEHDYNGLIEPMRISAGVDPLALSTQKQASDDRSSCLENPRLAEAESSLTENVTSPFQAEPAQEGPRRKITAVGDFRAKSMNRRAGTLPFLPLDVTLTFCTADV